MVQPDDCEIPSSFIGPVRAQDVVVALLTYRRLDGLAAALRDLTRHLDESATSASVLVIDNDVLPTASDIVARFGNVRYVHEPRPGIAAARNRALDEARDHRLLVFIDDDERPQPGWLNSLLDCWQRTHPAAVAGPVVSEFTVTPDPWIEAGRFFHRQRHPTGTEVPQAATNNLLLDLDAIRDLGLRFDDRFGLSGGSDAYFTRSLVRAGGRIVWCDDAVVVDVVPPERVTREWVLRRAERLGNSLSRVFVLMERPGLGRATMRIRLIGAALIRIAWGGARITAGRALRNRANHARGARMYARGRGLLTGAVGRVVVEYGRHGSDDLATVGS